MFLNVYDIDFLIFSYLYHWLLKLKEKFHFLIAVWNWVIGETTFDLIMMTSRVKEFTLYTIFHVNLFSALLNQENNSPRSLLYITLTHQFLNCFVLCNKVPFSKKNNNIRELKKLLSLQQSTHELRLHFQIFFWIFKTQVLYIFVYFLYFAYFCVLIYLYTYILIYRVYLSILCTYFLYFRILYILLYTFSYTFLCILSGYLKHRLYIYFCYSLT